MLSIVMLSDNMLSGVMLNVFMLRTVAPFKRFVETLKTDKDLAYLSRASVTRKNSSEVKMP